MRSKFVNSYISDVPAKFEKWLVKQGYESVCQEYPGATFAAYLLDDYLQDHPDQKKHERVLNKYAEGIGWISDYQEEYEDSDEPIEEDE